MFENVLETKNRSPESSETFSDVPLSCCGGDTFQVQQVHTELNIKFNEEIFNQALIRLEDKCLEISNQTLVEQGMQVPQKGGIEALNSKILKKKSYNVNELLQYIAEKKLLLIESKKQAYDFIMDHVNRGIGGVILLDAPGGTRKTFLISLILAEICAKKDCACIGMIWKCGNTDESNACLKQSFPRPPVKKVQLRTNMRVQLSNDEETRHSFETHLQIGEGTHPIDCVTGQIELTYDLCSIVNNQDELMNRKDKGETVLISRIPLISTDLSFQFKRLQFPVRLAFNITINKVQGQTLRYCGIYLNESCFSYSPLYVACSRVGNPKNLYIYSPNNKMTNLFYKQAFRVGVETESTPPIPSLPPAPYPNVAKNFMNEISEIRALQKSYIPHLASQANERTATVLPAPSIITRGSCLLSVEHWRSNSTRRASAPKALCIKCFPPRTIGSSYSNCRNKASGRPLRRIDNAEDALPATPPWILKGKLEGGITPEDPMGKGRRCCWCSWKPADNCVRDCEAEEPFGIVPVGEDNKAGMSTAFPNPESSSLRKR
ncbi:hypothetical protein J437_LFUL015190 [Ladona fulva]|uniref:ATP-dependent DNA helicase n=1 Tax=Ladona fulva TaxID=123851 RepID=A0A8K0KHT5_LADFU|nr:hypothetical protein J437_LFUL015190 [Ladona fulva]